MPNNSPRSKSKGASRHKAPTAEAFAAPRSFAIGLLLGIFLCLFVQQLLSPNLEEAPDSTTAGQEQAEVIPETTGPNIDFPTRLRNSEVLVPAPAPAEAREPVIFYLQAASFRNAEDANRARAEILLLNLEAEVTEFDNGTETWHRIIVGPFEGQSMVSKAQTTLLENGYGGMVLQRKE